MGAAFGLYADEAYLFGVLWVVQCSASADEEKNLSVPAQEFPGQCEPEKACACVRWQHLFAGPTRIAHSCSFMILL